MFWEVFLFNTKCYNVLIKAKKQSVQIVYKNK